MAWWGWLLLAAGAFIVVTAITFRALRATDRGRRFLALRTRAKLHFGRTLLRHPDVPLAAKAMLGVLVVYLAMPFDLIPDFLPVVGQADDIAMVVITVAVLLLVIPQERFEAALSEAEAAYPAGPAATKRPG